MVQYLNGTFNGIAPAYPGVPLNLVPVCPGAIQRQFYCSFMRALLLGSE